MEDGYNPLDLTDLSMLPFPRSLDFATARIEHPILRGVFDFTYGGNPNYVVVTLDPGALLVASDDFGVPLIAVNHSNRVAAINVYFGNFYTRTPGVFRALANTCKVLGEVR